MARGWNKWGSRSDTRDPWSQRDYRSYYRDDEESGQYSFLKKLVITAFLFTLVFGVHVTDTQLSRSMDESIRYLLTTDTDFGAVFNQLAKYAPVGLDQAVLKRIQVTATKPADPLLYMTKPVDDGKLAIAYGWQNNPALKQAVMYEGITIETALGAGVRAAAPGKVKSITENAMHGRLLTIDHGQDVVSLYGHLGEVFVKPEETVSQGQVIARIGKTAANANSSLYFELREKGKPIDPMSRIKGDLPVKEGK